ncbi:hypothetical protein RHSIM_Rhsim09G0115500 [Rhododendron simsii]|uniref:RING-type domain-containing protein n=1 Tax=Rhododendron simsii TaxID=118357 RepID=A0A834GL70_RHOSS|nr:hypothetical protein RHSIM_Rhsim09G0115500 [Rhododendron simsii]
MDPTESWDGKSMDNRNGLTIDKEKNDSTQNGVKEDDDGLSGSIHDDVQENRERLGIGLIKRYEHKHGCEKEMANNECAICLGEIEEGDEIRELRCDHVFHMVCLDRWVVGYRHETCPMCRGRLAPPRKWATGLIGEEEVLVFNLFPCHTNHRRSTRWLID